MHVLSFSSKNPSAYFPEQFWMASSGDKRVQLCTPKVKAAHKGLYAYSNRYVKVWTPPSNTWVTFVHQLKFQKFRVLLFLVSKFQIFESKQSSSGEGKYGFFCIVNAWERCGLNYSLNEHKTARSKSWVTHNLK